MVWEEASQTRSACAQKARSSRAALHGLPAGWNRRVSQEQRRVETSAAPTSALAEASMPIVPQVDRPLPSSLYMAPAPAPASPRHHAEAAVGARRRVPRLHVPAAPRARGRRPRGRRAGPGVARDAREAPDSPGETEVGFWRRGRGRGRRLMYTSKEVSMYSRLDSAIIEAISRLRLVTSRGPPYPSRR